MEKTFIIFGINLNDDDRAAAEKFVISLFAEKGQKVRKFDSEVDDRPFVCLYLSMGLFKTIEGKTRYYLTTLHGRSVGTFFGA